MTILVLGDSFADAWGDEFHSEYAEIHKKGWPYYLSELMQEDVECYGMGATAIEYSYNMFLMHYNPDKHSKVVFCMTNHARHFSYVLDDDRKEIKECLSFIADIQHSKMCMAGRRIPYPEKIKSQHQQILMGVSLSEALYPDSSEWKRTAVRDSLERRVPENQLLIMDIQELMNIQRLDYEHLSIDFDVSIENKRRACHISQTQNWELAEYIKKYFNKDFDIKKIFKKPLEYFTPSETREQAGFNN